MFLLVRIMHWAPSMAGLAVTIVIIPLTTLLGKALAKSRREQVRACVCEGVWGWPGAGAGAEGTGGRGPAAAGDRRA